MALALLALLAAGVQEPPPDGPPIVFEGNVVLPDGVYLAALDLPRGAVVVDAALARTVARKLRTFLRRGGYDLSTVMVSIDRDVLRVRIDEGRLERIVFLGEGVLQAIRLKLELDLPGRVFNRELVERKLREVGQRAGLKSWRWELSPLASAPMPRAQIDDLEPLKGLPFLQPGRPYELLIYVTPQEGGGGISPEIEIDSLEGGGVGAEYRAPLGASFGGRVAGAVRNKLSEPGSDVVLSRAWLEGRYRGLHLFTADGPQPSLRVRADFLNRQRADLSLERFDQLVLSTSLTVEQPAGQFVRVGMGVGGLRRFLYGLQPIGPLLPVVATTPKAQNRAFGELWVDLDATPEELRRDRHALAVAHAMMFPFSQTLYLGGRAQGSERFGWHELWIRASGVALTGEVPFSDEEPLAEHVHGPFGGLYTRKLVTVGGDFRYSLLRDFFKVGPYLETTLFRAIDRVSDGERPRLGVIAGGVVEALFFDQLVLETWAGFGVLSDGSTSGGLALSLKQAY